jgi:hypothetical protein
MFWQDMKIVAGLLSEVERCFGKGVTYYQPIINIISDAVIARRSTIF